MTENVDQLYYVGLKAFIEHENRLLIIRSALGGIYASSYWGLPGGKITTAEMEAPLTTALSREISEELGNACQVEIGKIFHAWKYVRPGKHPIMLLGLQCQFLGGEICLSPEFDKYTWIDKGERECYDFLPGHTQAIGVWECEAALHGAWRG